MKLKICYIISNLSIGGAQLLLFDLINNLKNENLEITVITIDSGYYIKKFEDAGIRIIDIKSKGLINPLIFFRLKNKLKEILIKFLGILQLINNLKSNTKSHKTKMS